MKIDITGDGSYRTLADHLMTLDEAGVLGQWLFSLGAQSILDRLIVDGGGTALAQEMRDDIHDNILVIQTFAAKFDIKLPEVEE